MIEKRLNKSYVGRLRDLNPGPPVPEAGIIPLDQADTLLHQKLQYKLFLYTITLSFQPSTEVSYKHTLSLHLLYCLLHINKINLQKYLK